ncbi:hypothetical protein BC941DRAFT_488283 [Chlamydoabsidia padenii]|nr:hypothetical protein BC941DRAFT_488283 [Chlamydoabsidia padenii]
MQKKNSTIQDIPQLNETDQNGLMEKFDMTDLLVQVSLCPKQSSPGDDGLSYPFLAIIFRLNIIQPILLDVYNDAL